MKAHGLEGRRKRSRFSIHMHWTITSNLHVFSPSASLPPPPPFLLIKWTNRAPRVSERIIFYSPDEIQGTGPGWKKKKSHRKWWKSSKLIPMHSLISFNGWGFACPSVSWNIYIFFLFVKWLIRTTMYRVNDSTMMKPQSQVPGCIIILNLVCF